MKRPLKMVTWATVAVACVILDQLTKAWALDTLVPGKAYPFIPHIMDLVLVRNTGAAFSLGEGAGWLFILVALAVVVVLGIALWRTPDVPLYLVIIAGLVAGGGCRQFN